LSPPLANRRANGKLLARSQATSGNSWVTDDQRALTTHAWEINEMARLGFALPRPRRAI
jgi:hypothetical protein